MPPLFSVPPPPQSLTACGLTKGGLSEAECPGYRQVNRAGLLGAIPGDQGPGRAQPVAASKWGRASESWLRARGMPHCQHLPPTGQGEHKLERGAGSKLGAIVWKGSALPPVGLSQKCRFGGAGSRRGAPWVGWWRAARTPSHPKGEHSNPGPGSGLWLHQGHCPAATLLSPQRRPWRGWRGGREPSSAASLGPEGPCEHTLVGVIFWFICCQCSPKCWGWGAGVAVEKTPALIDAGKTSAARLGSYL